MATLIVIAGLTTLVWGPALISEAALRIRYYSRSHGYSSPVKLENHNG